MIKLFAIVIWFPLWLIPLDDGRNATMMSASSKVGVAVMAFGTAYCALLITNHWNRRWLAVPLSLFMAFAWIVLKAYLDQMLPPNSLPYLQILLKLSQAVMPMFIGGLLAYVAHHLTSRVMARMSISNAFAGAFPTFGTAEDGGYRQEIDTALEQLETAFASLLSSVRQVVLWGAVLILLLPVFWLWLKGVESNIPNGTILGDLNVAIWLVVGICFGGILALVLLPAGRWLSLALSALLIGGITFCGLLIAGYFDGAIYTRLELLLYASMIIAVTPVAGALGCAMVQLIAVLIIRATLPQGIQCHLLGQKYSRTQIEPHPHFANCCEDCGYHLEGLPTFVCEKCGLTELRCPECGHSQPAHTMHARAVTRLLRSHRVIRIISWLCALGITFFSAIPFIFIGIELFRARTFVNLFAEFRGYVSFGLAFVLLLAPLRISLLHWRPWPIGAMLVVAIPSAAMLLGRATINQRDSSAMIGVFVVLVFLCAISSLLIPFLWRYWLLLILPARTASDVYAWQSSLALRGPRPNEPWEPVYHPGREIPLLCRQCGVGIAGSPILTCAQCGTASACCPSCSTRRPISLVRGVFENLVTRARHMTLTCLCAVAGICCLIAGLVVWINTESELFNRIAYDYSPWHESFGEMILWQCVRAIIFGLIAGTAMINRRRDLAGVVGLAAYLFCSLALPLLEFSHYSRLLDRRSILIVIILGTASAAVFAATVFAPLFLEWIALALLPRPTARALFSWLTGRNSLDNIATRFSQRNPSSSTFDHLQ